MMDSTKSFDVKKGDKLLCIDNTDVEDKLTIGKIYKVRYKITTDFCKERIYIICDRGRSETAFFYYRFKLLKTEIYEIF